MEKYFIKFLDKKEYLDDLNSGKIMFSPVKKFIDLERLHNKKGIGDKADGAVVISKEIRFGIGEGFEDTPIFCLTVLNERNCIVKDNKLFINDVIDSIRADFPKYKYALLVKEPKDFITDLTEGLKNCNARLISEEIKYFEIGENNDDISLDYIKHLFDDENGITEKNRYNSMFTKDKFFEKQSEFRFLISNFTIKEPQIYNFVNSHIYNIYTLDELENGIQL